MNPMSLTASSPAAAGADHYGSEVSWQSSSFPLLDNNDNDEGTEDLWQALVGDMSFSLFGAETKGSSGSEAAMSIASSSSFALPLPLPTMSLANPPPHGGNGRTESTTTRRLESTANNGRHGDTPSRHEHSNDKHDNNNNNNTSDDDDYDDDYDDEQEDILSVRETIEFLTEKQTLLTKVFRMIHSDEARYDASVALQCVQEQQSRCKINTPSDGIWMDAKRILKEICEKSGFVDLESGTRASTTTINSSNKPKPKTPGPSDPDIDKSTVRQLSSRQYGQLTMTMGAATTTTTTTSSSSSSQTLLVKEENDDDSVRSSPPPFLLNDGQSWIAKALAQSGSAHKRTSHSNDPCWEVSHSSSSTSANSASPVPLAAVDLQEALSFTTEARFLTDSSPPYAIVHANGAFLRLAELDEGNMLLSGSLTGKPVESILDLSFSEQSNTCTRSGFMQGLLVFPGKRKHSATTTSVVCNLRAIPVLDQTSKRRKLSPSGLSSQDPLSLYASMSHVLFQVQSRDQSSLQQPPAFPNEYTSNSSMVRDVKLAVHTQVGTVG